MSCKGDIQVVVEDMEGLLARYKGFYDAETSDALGLHCEYNRQSFLLDKTTQYRWDQSPGRVYLYNHSGELVMVLRANRRQIDKILRRDRKGTQWT